MAREGKYCVAIQVQATISGSSERILSASEGTNFFVLSRKSSRYSLISDDGVCLAGGSIFCKNSVYQPILFSCSGHRYWLKSHSMRKFFLLLFVLLARSSPQISLKEGFHI
jgi:hypothetical protein